VPTKADRPHLRAIVSLSYHKGIPFKDLMEMDEEVLELYFEHFTAEIEQLEKNRRR
jgi:hypothetical protein